MPYLVLVRHGESEWNALGLWTGLTDVKLSEKGVQEAKEAATSIRHISFDAAFTSGLKRSQQTLEEMLGVLGQKDLSYKILNDLNERDYGDYTGKNKWEIQQLVGDEEFLRIRRSWDYAVKNGESLKMVYDRVKPCYEQFILPQIWKGHNVIIAAHGNSLRALIKYLDNISDDKIVELEVGTAKPIIYDFIISKN